MDQPDPQVTDGPERQIIETVRDEIFSFPLLPQQEALVLFGQLDQSLRGGIETLIDTGSFVERYLSDVIAEVAASVTHGRTIYETEKNRGEHEDADQQCFKRKTDVQFLEQASRVVRLLASYRGDGTDTEAKGQTKQTLRQTRFARLVYEEVLERFMSLTDRYCWFAAEAARLHAKLHGAVSDPSVVADQYARATIRMEQVEEGVQMDRDVLYHACLTVLRQHRRQLRLRETIYKPYLRIVYKEAKRHATGQQQVLDNLQNGAQGLLRAISCYNCHKQVSFSSYAHWWIRQAILFHIKEHSNFMKLPVTTWQTFTSIEKQRATLASRTGRDDLEALAEHTGQSVEKLKDVYDSVQTSHVHSLDYEVDDSGRMLLVDVIPDHHHDNQARETNRHEDVVARLGNLDQDERFCVCLAHGLVEMLPERAAPQDQEVVREAVRQRVAPLL